MFGFLNPSDYSNDYRAVYSRCCQHQRLHFGLLSLPYLSYEAIFLYLFWMDATSKDVAFLPAQKCCRLRKISDNIPTDETLVGEFCSAFSILLAGTKIEDDIRDKPSIRARFLHRILEDRLSYGRQYFEDLSPGFIPAIEALIAAHLELENKDALCTMEEYTLPTAKAFGLAFGLFAKLPSMGSQEAVLHELGFKIGAALIAFDCASDWHRDQEHLEFNPLENWQEVKNAVAYARRSLREAERTCRELFGESRTVDLLKSVRHSIIVEDETTSSSSHRFSPLTRIAAFGGLSSVLVGSSDSDSDCGAACCAIICCAIAASACKGQVIGTSSVETGPCGGKKVVHRKPAPCD